MSQRSLDPGPAPSSTSDPRALSPKPLTLTPVWILGSGKDLGLIIATCFLVVPLLEWASGRLSWERIALYVVTFGATGHHLPGMMRAYGDRALFRRFRVRFTLAPIVFIGATVYSTMHDLEAIYFFAAAWGVWHATMQSYGVARIYDAKVAAFSPLTRRLDLLLCGAWFGFGTLLSPVRMGKLLDLFYASGGLHVAADVLSVLRIAGFAGVVAVTVVYLGHLVWQRHHGQPISSAKLLHLAISIGLWWYTCVTITHMVVGVAVWEICHDIQYLTIVWIYNRGRVKNDPKVGRFTSFLFRNSGALVGLYVGLVFGYGYLALLGHEAYDPTTNDVLTGLITASGLLHFYFDGFIWGVREQATAQSLALKKDASPVSVLQKRGSGRRHLLLWAASGLFVVTLSVAQRQRQPSRVENLSALVAALPSFTRGHNDLGTALAREGGLEAARRHYREALRLQPDHADARVNLLLAEAAGVSSAGRPALYRQALEVQPDHARTHFLLAQTLAELGDDEQALTHFRAAVDQRPDQAALRFGLARALARQDDIGAAVTSYEAGLRLRPEAGIAHEELASLLERAGRRPEALAHYRSALRLDPERLGAAIGLAWILATSDRPELRDGEEALRLAEAVRDRAKRMTPKLLDTLAAAYASSGRFDAAQATARRAVRLAHAAGDDALARDIEARLERYDAGQPYRDSVDRGATLGSLDGRR
jgi:tetratricopeptide (TPR) repeat protein